MRKKEKVSQNLRVSGDPPAPWPRRDSRFDSRQFIFTRHAQIIAFHMRIHGRFHSKITQFSSILWKIAGGGHQKPCDLSHTDRGRRNFRETFAKFAVRGAWLFFYFLHRCPRLRCDLPNETVHLCPIADSSTNSPSTHRTSLFASRLTRPDGLTPA